MNFQDVKFSFSGQSSEKRRQLDRVCKTHIKASNIYSITGGHSDGGKYEAVVLDRSLRPKPGLSQYALLSLSHPKYGLPEPLVRKFSFLGINSIHPWQLSCLPGRHILRGEKNLVYAAPTGGRKSLIADVPMLKRVLEDPTKKAILVLPYVALVREKLRCLRQMVEGVSKHIYGLDQYQSRNSQLPKWVNPTPVQYVCLAFLEAVNLDFLSLTLT